MKVMHAEEASLVATGNDVADAAPQTLQRWPQLQDVLGLAQTGEVQSQGQRSLCVKAGQARLGRKTGWMMAGARRNQNARVWWEAGGQEETFSQSLKWSKKGTTQCP